MSDPRGYAPSIVAAVRAANRRMPGVQLGLLCIRNNVSVIQVARQFNVSRPAVYNWFTGRATPRSAQLEKIRQVLAEYA